MRISMRFPVFTFSYDSSSAVRAGHSHTTHCQVNAAFLRTAWCARGECDEMLGRQTRAYPTLHGPVEEDPKVALSRVFAKERV